MISAYLDCTMHVQSHSPFVYRHVFRTTLALVFCNFPITCVSTLSIVLHHWYSQCALSMLRMLFFIIPRAVLYWLFLIRINLWANHFCYSIYFAHKTCQCHSWFPVNLGIRENLEHACKFAFFFSGQWKVGNMGKVPWINKTELGNFVWMIAWLIW